MTQTHQEITTPASTPTKKLILKAYICDEYCDGFDHAIIEIDQAFIDRIRYLNKLVIENKVYKICEFDWRCDMMKSNYDFERSDNGKQPLMEPDDEYGARTDCDTLSVNDTSFNWSGYLKNTNIRWSTDNVMISDLDTFETIDNRDNVKLEF